MEAEYLSIARGVREALWIMKVLSEMGLEKEWIEIGCDNTAAIAFSNNKGSSERTKHISISYHFTQDYVEKGIIKLKHIPTDEMAADIMTYPLEKIKFDHCKTLLGMRQQ